MQPVAVWLCNKSKLIKINNHSLSFTVIWFYNLYQGTTIIMAAKKIVYLVVTE